MYKLFVVDDENEIRTGLCRYFPWEDIGFEVIGQAENGKQALDFIKRNTVDVFLCDIKMPVMNGLELVEELQKQKSKIKIIFLSGYRDFEFAQKALSLGVRNYIVKSTKFNELVTVFKKIKDELDEEYSKTKNISEVLPEESSAASNYYDRIISTIKDYVKTHYKDVELEDVSELIHMNPNYISKFFKQRTGQYFSDYLLSVRMEKATELLNDIKYKTYEISEMLGYSNVKNFTRTFKSYYGKSPREYRNSEHLDEIH